MCSDGGVHNPQLMDRLVDFILGNEEKLMECVLFYAKLSGYSNYASTLVEAWRISIAGLSGAFKEAVETHGGIPLIRAEQDIIKDPMTNFGVTEAQRHRERGIKIDMFLGLFKYYRRAYIELIRGMDEEPHAKQLCLDSMISFFDRIEIAFCSEWVGLDKEGTVEELQSSNRFLTNEKNKYLTIFESLSLPVFLFDKHFCIENLNYSASVLLKGQSVPGGRYYEQARDPYIKFVRKKSKRELQAERPTVLSVESVLPWLSEDLKSFSASEDNISIIEKEIKISDGAHYFEVSLSKMLDISGKFEGIVAILNDMTHKKTAEMERIEIEKLQSAVETAGAACHELNQPLQIIMARLEMALEAMTDQDTAYSNIEEIDKETARIQGILNRLQNITTYKTRNYAGSTKILDIN